MNLLNPFKKKPKELTAEQRYEIVQEWERIKHDDEKAMKFGIENLPYLPEEYRYAVVIYTYGEYRKAIGQAESEQWVADRLHLFPTETREQIIEEIWGGRIDCIANKCYKTGRKERPSNVNEWEDPKVPPWR